MSSCVLFFYLSWSIYQSTFGNLKMSCSLLHSFPIPIKVMPCYSLIIPGKINSIPKLIRNPIKKFVLKFGNHDPNPKKDKTRETGQNMSWSGQGRVALIRVGSCSF